MTNETDSEKTRLLLKAIAAHKKLIKECHNFETFDRHFYGLKQISEKNGIAVPGFFDSIAFQKLGHLDMTTSQVSSQFEAVTCFGALDRGIDDSYSCCYNVMDEKIIFSIGSLKTSKITSAERFKNTLNESLLEFKDLLLKCN